MKKVTTAVFGLFAMGALASGTAVADDAAMQVHNTRGCIACHAVGNQMVGPSYKAISAKYGADAVDDLVAAVKKGSSGKWGPIAMPPHPHVSDDEIRTVVEWIVTLE